MIAVMSEEYRSVESKLLMKPYQAQVVPDPNKPGKQIRKTPVPGFLDDPAENGLILNMSGLEYCFPEVSKAPVFIGKRKAEGNFDAARRELVEWWKSHIE